LIIKCVFWFCLQLLPQTFLILRSIQRDIVINVHTTSCHIPVMLVGSLNFRGVCSKNIQIRNLMKTRPMGAQLFHADGHDEGNGYYCPTRFAVLRTCLKSRLGFYKQCNPGCFLLYKHDILGRCISARKRTNILQHSFKINHKL
jgi:hypothetical protein